VTTDVPVFDHMPDGFGMVAEVATPGRANSRARDFDNAVIVRKTVVLLSGRTAVAYVVATPKEA
jgi:hypothetical protein